MNLRCASAAVVVVAALTVVGAAGPVSADTITVTTAVDTIAADGQTSLREAVLAANGTVGPDTIVLGASQTYVLGLCAAGPLLHTGSNLLTVEGNLSTVTQACNSQQMWVGDSGLSSFDLRNLNLVGGTNAGPAVLTQGMAVQAGTIGTLRLANVDITAFDAAGGTIVESGSGHSVAPFFLDIGDSSFSGNVGSVIGGDQVSVSINNTSIANNTGSAINMADGWPLNISNSTISDNTRSGVSNSGQGFKINAIMITDTTIANNGRVGVFCSNCGDLTIQGSTITGNGLGATATPHRGGVSTSVQRQTPRSAITVTNSTITGNASDEPGAGVRVSLIPGGDPARLAPQTTITGSTIGSNTTPAAGGGIAVATGLLNISTSMVTNNSATGDGGGVWYADSSGPYDISVDSSTISGNTAGSNGGGIYIAETAAAAITSSTLTGNNAAVRGGGAWVEALSLNLSASRVTSNQAVEGGGLNVTTDGLLIDASTIDANSSVSYGGAGLLTMVDGIVRNSTIVANSSGKGGGFAVFGAITLAHVTMASNTAIEGAHLWRNAFSPTTITSSALVTPLATMSCLLGGSATTATSFFADGSCGSTASDEVSAADPQLAALAINGGPTPTMLPATSSPVGAQVPLAMCTVITDQRGVARPQGANCDAGAVEIVEAAVVAAITGTAGNDSLFGTNGADVINALAGNDIIVARAGNDVVDAGAGDDIVFGDAGDDVLDGGPGRDLLTGGPGIDQLIGGPGVDVLVASVGDTAIGGPGLDVCWIPGRWLPTDC